MISRKTLKVPVILMLLVTLLAANLPQSAQAATTCRAYYTVRSGDSTTYIAQTFQVKWATIAAANDLDKPYKLKVGQQLCIPEADKTAKDVAKKDTGKSNKFVVKEGKTHPNNDSDAVFRVTVSAGRITISTSKFNDEHTYLVKVRAYKNVGVWYTLKKISVDDGASQSFSLTLPTELREEPYVSVCMKDQSNDELLCRNVENK